MSMYNIKNGEKALVSDFKYINNGFPLPIVNRYFIKDGKSKIILSKDTKITETPVEVVPEYPILDLPVFSDSASPISSTIKNNILSWQQIEGKTSGDRVDNKGGGLCDNLSDGGWSTRWFSEISGGNRILDREWDGTEHLASYFRDSLVANGEVSNIANYIPQAYFDNETSQRYIKLLAEYWQTHQTDSEVKVAIEKGINYVIRGQKKRTFQTVSTPLGNKIISTLTSENNGWWSEQQALEDNPLYEYHNKVTINDNVQVTCMDMLYRIAKSIVPFQGSIVTPSKRLECQTVFDVSLQTIIDAQFKQDGVKTIWTGKMESDTYEPIWARNFEGIGVMTLESSDLLRLLVSLPNRTPELKVCIHYAVEWFKNNKYANHQYVLKPTPNTSFDNYFPSYTGRNVWFRYYEYNATSSEWEGRFYQDNSVYTDITSLTTKKEDYTWGTRLWSEYTQKSEWVLGFNSIE